MCAEVLVVVKLAAFFPVKRFHKTAFPLLLHRFLIKKFQCFFLLECFIFDSGIPKSDFHDIIKTNTIEDTDKFGGQICLSGLCCICPAFMISLRISLRIETGGPLKLFHR